MKKLGIAITIFIISSFIILVFYYKNTDGEATSTVQITVTNQSQSIVKNLYISSGQYPKFNSFSDIEVSKSEFMVVDFPVVGEDAVVLTYTDELGIDHNAPVIEYLMGYDEVNVTIISADKDGLIIEMDNN